MISHASIIIPFALGMGLAYFIYDSFAPSGVEFLSFGLFMGIAMSINSISCTCQNSTGKGGLQKKQGLELLSITCAAADDITAWCLLAAVIAIVKAGSFISSLYIMGLAIIYVFDCA